MAAYLLRMLALIAVVLMPAGMANASAAPHAAPAAKSASHCPGEHEQERERAPSEQMSCMACAALPAADASQSSVALLPKAPRLLALAFTADGIVPEIATPPPKQG